MSTQGPIELPNGLYNPYAGSIGGSFDDDSVEFDLGSAHDDNVVVTVACTSDGWQDSQSTQLTPDSYVESVTLTFTGFAAGADVAYVVSFTSDHPDGSYSVWLTVRTGRAGSGAAAATPEEGDEVGDDPAASPVDVSAG